MYSQQAFAGRPDCGPRGRHFGPHSACSGRQHGGGGPGHRGWGRRFGGWQPVPVNIETTDTSFVLTLFAAGLTKENIQLTVQDDVLTIAYHGTDAEAAEAAPDPRYTRREFRNPSFERAFQLNSKVLTDSISARYADGILTVTLPKNPATNQAAQGISVS